MSNISLNRDIGYWCQVIIIEANTVPGMTPSTVLIHQVFSIMVFGVLFVDSHYLVTNKVCLPQEGMPTFLDF